MRVVHILKDGTVLNDITGHVVRIEDAEPLYQLIDSINRESRKVHSEKSQEVKVCC